MKSVCVSYCTRVYSYFILSVFYITKSLPENTVRLFHTINDVVSRDNVVHERYKRVWPGTWIFIVSVVTTRLCAGAWKCGADLENRWCTGGKHILIWSVQIIAVWRRFLCKIMYCLFKDRFAKTIDLKTLLLCAHVRKVVAFLLVLIVIVLIHSFVSITTTKTNWLKYFLFNLQMSRNTSARDLYTQSWKCSV